MEPLQGTVNSTTFWTASDLRTMSGLDRVNTMTLCGRKLSIKPKSELTCQSFAPLRSFGLDLSGVMDVGAAPSRQNEMAGITMGDLIVLATAHC